jgi:hypothetical protein
MQPHTQIDLGVCCESRLATLDAVQCRQGSCRMLVQAPQQCDKTEPATMHAPQQCDKTEPATLQRLRACMHVGMCARAHQLTTRAANIAPWPDTARTPARRACMMMPRAALFDTEAR